MALLPFIVADPSGSRPHQPLILLQSSTSQTCLPILRSLIQPAKRPAQTLLFCFLYPSASLIADWPNTLDDSLKVFDYTERIPGYSDAHDSREDILAAVHSGTLIFPKETIISPQTAPPGTLHVIIDSIDTLATDLASDSQTYKFIRTLLALIMSRSQPSVLILHLLRCPLLPILTQIHLSPTLTHIIAHPPSLLTHLASAYLTPPPPSGATDKFWSVFILVSERVHESEILVYGSDGSGTCSGGGADLQEFVVELTVRGIAAEGRKRGIERTIEGWSGTRPENLQRLDALKSIWSRGKSSDEVSHLALDSIIVLSNISEATHRNSWCILQFETYSIPREIASTGSLYPMPMKVSSAACATIDLNLVSAGEPIFSVTPTKGAILYEPDSADDIDEDDPDEDLDI
ncbi:hypothetical protein JVU11DRAFT_5202 [Chiua virens]|nr:hypothetical protein JVU11DRAFT_5202 [Chiua virens]